VIDGDRAEAEKKVWSAIEESLLKDGLQLINVNPSGNCFFEACSLYFFGSPALAGLLREMVSDHLKSTPGKESMFKEGLQMMYGNIPIDQDVCDNVLAETILTGCRSIELEHTNLPWDAYNMIFRGNPNLYADTVHVGVLCSLFAIPLRIHYCWEGRYNKYNPPLEPKSTNFDRVDHWFTKSKGKRLLPVGLNLMLDLAKNSNHYQLVVPQNSKPPGVFIFTHGKHSV
jgi:hypothetical protein